MKVKFYELAVGAEFSAWGRRYRKVAMSMAQGERDLGTIFAGETEVESDGPVLSVEIAAKWKPPGTEWVEHLWVAPGQSGGNA